MHDMNKQSKQDTVRRANKKSDVYSLVCFLNIVVRSTVRYKMHVFCM